MALYGYDVSCWQSVGTGDSAQNFLIIKATEGTGYVDKSCDKHYQRAKQQGKLLGVYHFARPDLNKGEDGARREANYFYNNCKNYFREAIVVLDWEQPGTTGQVSWAKAWLDEVYRLSGVRPLIYMSASVVNNNNWSAISGYYGLWIAGYPAKYNVANPPTPSVNDMPYKIGSWAFWYIWQYSSSAGTLDRNICNGDATSWRKYANPAYVAVKPKEEPKQEEQPMTPPEEIASSGQKEQSGKDSGKKVPEQPESTDKGLTKEEWDEIISKAEQSVKLAEGVAKSAGVTIRMSNKVYDVLKVIASTVLPAIAALYIGLSNIWGFGFGEQVDETIQLVIVTINAVLGLAVIKSSSDYKKDNA